MIRNPGQRTWDSKPGPTDSHPIKGTNQRWFRSEEDAESYRVHRNLRVRAMRAGFPGTEEGINAFQAWAKRKPVKLTDKDKVKKIRRLIDKDNQSMADFAHAVINIIEDR